jgi:hypothetical protein
MYVCVSVCVHDDCVYVCIITVCMCMMMTVCSSPLSCMHLHHFTQDHDNPEATSGLERTHQRLGRIEVNTQHLEEHIVAVEKQQTLILRRGASDTSKSVICLLICVMLT